MHLKQVVDLNDHLAELLDAVDDMDGNIASWQTCGLFTLPQPSGGTTRFRPFQKDHVARA